MARTVFDTAWDQFMDGTGNVPFGTGNELNPPGGSFVEAGPYQFIQPFAFQGFGHEMTDIQPIPMDYRDWGQFPVNAMDPSGLTGGGYAAQTNVNMPVENDLYFDAENGVYYDLGDTQ
jgi:hypothetical protein